MVVAFTLGLAGIVGAWTVYTNPAAVNLGATADNFAVLAGAAVNDTLPSTVTGDVGLSPTTGAAIAIPSTEVTGTIYSIDGAGLGDVTNPGLLTTAKGELSTAYNNANLRTPDALVGDLSGQTLGPGVYGDNNAPNSMEISAAGTKTLTLDGGGDPNAVFIFQSDSTLTTSAGSVVNLINEAQACNVFWQVGSSATLGTGSNFKGTIMAAVTITDNGGSTVTGRLLADADNTDADSTGAVTLNNTNVTVPTCAVAAPAVVPPATGTTRRLEGTINVVKLVINDNGGAKTVADFPLFLNGEPIVSGETNDFVADGTTALITETSNPNYARSFSGDCDSNGSFKFTPGTNNYCIITNNDIGAPVVVPPVPPLIDVVKVPSPLALPNGPGTVTYTYTLHNIGTVPVTDVTMVGDTCSPIILASGDTNNDVKLDVSETWTYRCSTTLSATHTNTVVATGWANGISATDIASATVVVGEPIVPPLIHLVKKPSVFTLPAPGGAVTYAYTVTNPGTEPLSNVNITDDKCTGLPGRVVGHPGDINKNNLLESNETWSFTCQSNLTQTTTNTGTAAGSANNLTARDFAIATVVVAAAVPKLPATGLAPLASSTPWNIIVPVGIFAVSILFYLARRKQTI